MYPQAPTTVGWINTRNQQKGKVTQIIHGDVISEVHMETPTGAEVLAPFKSTEVMLATVDSRSISN